jgi:hypothetical protein
MDPFPLQRCLYNHNIRNSNLWSIKYSVYADQHRHVTKKTTDSSYIYYDCRGTTVVDRGSMAWMPAYIAVRNLRSMISMNTTGQSKPNLQIKCCTRERESKNKSSKIEM